MLLLHALEAAAWGKAVQLVVSPILVFASLGGVAVVLPRLLGNGKDVVELAFAGEVATPLLLALFVLKPVATAACLGSGAPGGLFTPTLTTGRPRRTTEGWEAGTPFGVDRSGALAAFCSARSRKPGRPADLAKRGSGPVARLLWKTPDFAAAARVAAAILTLQDDLSSRHRGPP